MTKDEALRMAFSVLSFHQQVSDAPAEPTQKAIDAIQQALAQPEMRKATREEKISNPGVYEVPVQPDTDMAYTIALQRAIEWHCDGKAVPPDVAGVCPHHSEMLNQALAQPEQEPWPAEPVGHMAGGVHPSKMTKSKAITEIYALFSAPHNADINLTGLNQVLDELMAQPEQEPVAWFHLHNCEAHFTTEPSEDMVGNYWTPLYTTPPQRPWVGLTEEEIKEIVGPWGDTPIKGYTRQLFDKIEAKLKEKNT